MSYDNFELQNFRTRAAQAKSRFQELKQVLRTDGAITCRHRLPLYKAIIWPTLWYALASVGVTVDVLRGVCSLLSVQLRKVSWRKSATKRSTYAKLVLILGSPCYGRPNPRARQSSLIIGEHHTSRSRKVSIVIGCTSAC